MQLTESNYYSLEAGQEYVSVSQYKDFVGTEGKLGCEACAMAKIRGEIVQEKTTPLLVGSYIDSFFEGTLAEFLKNNPEVISSRGSTAGELKSEYKQAQIMIDRAIKDDLFMKYMNGEVQVIMTGEIEGVPVKIKIDSTDGRRLTDLKTVEDINKGVWSPSQRRKLNFIEYWGYDIQAAVYREVYRQNTGDILPFYIAAISKNKTNNIAHPRLAVIQIPSYVMDDKLEEFKANIGRIADIKAGLIEPSQCGICDYCADTEDLKGVISMDSLLWEE